MSIRTVKKKIVKNTNVFKELLEKWSMQFEVCMLLNSNNYQQSYTSFDVCLAVDEFTSVESDFKGAFDKLKEYQGYTKDYIFGYLTYDVKNDTEDLISNNFDRLKFSDIYFFQPQKIIFVKDNYVEFHYLKMIDDEIDKDYENIIGQKILNYEASYNDIYIQSRISKENYFDKLEKIIKHINRGDIYEANFCQEFYAENVEINPYKVYKDLNIISEPPFATFMKLDGKYLLSASPERYIRKENTKIISQPIKGTAKRSADVVEDKKIADILKNDEKERAENIMIVDLVRNDLSKTAKKSTVKVEELCEVYSFKQVHQLISTVVSEVDHLVSPVQVIQDTFPMGSMTGAPKVSAMKIMEELEETKRGLYSGTVGYFTPCGDFDFNVIIRSILYNESERYVSYSVGGAITAKSDPEKEYQECLLKANAMKTVLERN